MKKGILYLFLLAGFFSLFACEYSPSAINPVEVDANPPAQVKIDLLNQPDTIFIPYSAQLSYRLSLEGGSSLEVEVLLGDSKVLSRGNSLEGSFTINSVFYESGYHPLKLKVTSNSGTNSLADHLGVEKLLFEKSWTVLFINDPPPPVTIQSISKNDNNHLLVKWDKYEGRLFNKYTLHRTVYPTHDDRWFNGYSSSQILYFDKPTDTVFVDSAYFGGKVVYSLYLDIDKFETEGSFKIFEEERPKIVFFETGEDGQMMVKWNKSAYPHMFDKYELYISNLSEKVFSSSNPDDTTYVFEEPLYFGSSIELELKILPTDATWRLSDSGTYSSYGYVHFGTPVPYHHRFLIDETSDTYFLYQTGTLMQYDATESKVREIALTVEDPINLLHINRDRKWIFAISGNRLLQINSATLNIEKSINLAETESHLSTINTMAVADSIIYFSGSQKSGKYYAIEAFNLHTQSVRKVAESYDDIESLIACTDQNFVYRNNRRMVGASMGDQDIPTFTLDTLDGYYGYSAYALPNLHQQDEFFVIDNKQIKTYSSADFTLLNEAPLEASFFTNAQVDPMSGNIGGSWYSQYYLVDPATGATVKEIKIINNQYRNYYFTLHHNALFSSSGYRMDMSRQLP